MNNKIIATGFSNSKKLPEAKESFDKKLGFQNVIVIDDNLAEHGSRESLLFVKGHIC